MDVTMTAQVAQVAQQAAALNPATLAVLGGLIMSHLVEPISEKIPAAWRPTLITLGMGMATAFTAMSQGVPPATALGYGVASVATAKLYHVAVFKDGGVLSFLNGLTNGISKPNGGTDATN